MLSAVSFNDGQTLTGLPDHKVESLIRQNLPQKTYSTIRVNTIDHVFPGASEASRSREIVLTRTSIDIGWQSMKVFFSALLLGADLPSEPVVDPDLLVQGLIGGANDAARLAGKQEVKKAFLACHRIKLILSDDCNYFQIETEQARFLVLARRAGQVASPILISLTEFAITEGLPLLLALIKK